MKKIFLSIVNLYFFSCNHGNRQPDIGYTWSTSISPFYIKKYMKGLDSFYANRGLITNMMVLNPENSIPITDSVLLYKYVIEFYNLDSIGYLQKHSNYLTLASLYDFNKRKWVRDEDSLKNNELEKFKIFFKDSVLTKVVKRYKNKVPDSLLFVGKADTIIIKPLK